MFTRTCSDDLLFGDVIGMNLTGKLQDGYVGVLVHVRIDVRLQRLQLI